MLTCHCTSVPSKIRPVRENLPQHTSGGARRDKEEGKRLLNNAMQCCSATSACEFEGSNWYGDVSEPLRVNLLVSV